MENPYRTPLHAFGQYPPDAAEVTDKHATERFCDAGVRFIEEYAGDSPFFLYVAFTSPHDPRIAPPKYAQLYPADHIPLPRNFLPVHPFDNGEMHVRDEGLARLPREAEEVCRHIADYYSMITHMDAEIGRMLDALKRKGIEDRTIVVYTSDHGLSVGQHGLMGKQNLYDHSIRIPFLLSGPNVPKGSRIGSLTCQMDIFPTLCDLSGVPIPGTVDGNSLVPLLTGERTGVHESVYSTYKDLQEMVRRGEWKLIRYHRSMVSDAGTDRIQLFNIERDPWETEDLASNPSYAKLLGELQEEMRQWQIRVKTPFFHP
jgi:arylsulfatase A-like enzyme